MRSTTLLRSTAVLGASLLREPLLHLTLLGGLVFAADHWAQSRHEDPSVIIVTAEVKEQARSSFRSAQGREPTDAELGRMREHWIDTEILYREGLALKLEQGDQTLRERVASKTMKILEANLQVPEADDATLRAWFEQRRADYDLQPSFDFSEALPTGPVTEAGARSLAEALNDERPDVQAGVRLFEKHPRQAVVESFGPELASALDRVPLGKWHVLASHAGPSIIRLESREPGRAVTFEAVRARVRRHWMDTKARELRSAAVRKLGEKYTVQVAGGSS